MRKLIAIILPASFAISGLAHAQNRDSQMNMDFLIDMLRSASAAHAKVKDLQLEQNVAPESHPVRPGALNQRTAAMVGTGAGVGVAIGGMSGNQKGVLIGALAGGAGGLIIDQILKHRAAKQELLYNAPLPPEPHLELKERPAPPPRP